MFQFKYTDIHNIQDFLILKPAGASQTLSLVEVVE